MNRNNNSGAARNTQNTGQYYPDPRQAQRSNGQSQRPAQNQYSGNGARPAQNRSAQGNQNPQSRSQAQQPRQEQSKRRSAGSASQSRSGRPTPRRQTSRPKVKLTPEQIEIDRARRQREKYKMQKQRKEALKVFFMRLMLFLLVFAVMCGATAAVFFLNLTRQDSTDVSGYSYKIGDDSYSLKYSDAVREGRVYVSFSDVAELCGLATVGSPDDIKYVIKGEEAETIRFITGTREVYVNTVETRLSGDSFWRDGELYVPADFVAAYFKGLDVQIDEKKHTVTISRVLLNELDEKGNLKKGEEPIYDQLCFLLASPAPLEGIDEEDAKALVKTPDMGFLLNLTAYEEYMNPGNTKEYLTLVNVDHLLDSTYVPQDLVEVENTRKDRAKQQLRLYAAKALEALFKEMAEETGFTDVTVTSGYRGYSYQQSLFNQQLQKNSHLGDGAYAAAAAVVNPPGASEHQSGLCIDMHNIPTGADVSFGETEQFKWLSENCWKFGFILRYPEDKIDKTGISYEPWHYRYVGRYHAQKMYEMGMCLEEYCAYLGMN